MENKFKVGQRFKHRKYTHIDILITGVGEDYISVEISSKYIKGYPVEFLIDEDFDKDFIEMQS